MSPLTPGEYNRDIPLEDRHRIVAHELGHFYQAHRLVEVNLDVTFGYHIADTDDPVATRALIRTADGRGIVQSRTHGAAFVQKLDELVTSGILNAYQAARQSGCRMLGGGEMEKALYGGESQGDFDDVQLLRFRLSQRGMTESEQQAFEEDIRAEVRQSLTSDVLQMIRCAVSVIVREHFDGERTSGDVIYGILKGCQHDSEPRTENLSDD
jgi:hypothetical protein